MGDKCSKGKMFAVRVYIVLSLLFILFIAYTYLRGVVYQGGYQTGLQTGQLQTLEALFTENQKAECKPVIIKAGENKTMELIDVKCLQQASTEPQGQGVVPQEQPAPVQ